MKQKKIVKEVKPKLNLISLFSTPVVQTNIDRNFTKKEIECIANIPMCRDAENLGSQFKEINPLVPPQIYASQSKDYQLFNTFVEELKDIKTFCEQELKRYLEDIEGVDTNITNLNITASWLNKLEPQGFRSMHNHHNSHLSGILYIRCLPNDLINFHSLDQTYNRTLQLPKKKVTPINATSAAVKIEEGDLLIFPSLVPHEVGVNETKDKERISLSFDTWPTYLPSLYYPFK